MPMLLKMEQLNLFPITGFLYSFSFLYKSNAETSSSVFIISANKWELGNGTRQYCKTRKKAHQRHQIFSILYNNEKKIWFLWIRPSNNHATPKSSVLNLLPPRHISSHRVVPLLNVTSHSRKPTPTKIFKFLFICVPEFDVVFLTGIPYSIWL